MLAQLSSGARGMDFGLSLHLSPYFAYVLSHLSDFTAVSKFHEMVHTSKYGNTIPNIAGYLGTSAT